MSRRSFILWIGILVFYPSLATGKLIKGTVFLDQNKNQVFDENEKGVKAIQVTNGEDIILTDDQGKYRIEAEEFVYICKPAGYAVPKIYRSLEEKNFDFALQLFPPTDTFSFAVLTDVHLAENIEEVNQYMGKEWDPISTPNPVEVFSQYIDEIKELNFPISFVVNLGDLIADGTTASVETCRKWFDLYNHEMERLGVPVYNVMGNHDVVGVQREDIPLDTPGYGKKLFKEYYGPTYYSFNKGRWHFVVLDPNVESEKVSVKFEIDARQLKWLERDLQLNPDSPKFVFFHEPFLLWKRNEVLFLEHLFEENKVKFCFTGHLHLNSCWRKGEEENRVGYIILGAACGDWWGPERHNADSTPCGYRIVSVDGDYATTVYKVEKEKQQVTIANPEVEYPRNTRAGGTQYQNILWTMSTWGEFSVLSDDLEDKTVLIADVVSLEQVERVEYSLDGKRWHPMKHQGGLIWKALWNTSAFPPASEGVIIRLNGQRDFPLSLEMAK